MVLKNADLLLGAVDGILDHDTINTFRIKESFFDRWNDEAMDTSEYDLPILENEKSVEQTRNQERQELKILTPDQMTSRLQISLAQLKAENNSGKLKNEMRQVV